jgi:hypothetical protein
MLLEILAVNTPFGIVKKKVKNAFKDILGKKA